MIWDEFGILVKKYEAERPALGSTGKPLASQFPAAARRDEPGSNKGEHKEEQQAGAERGSFHQAAASYRASSRRRSRSPRKDTGGPQDDGSHLRCLPWDGAESEAIDLQRAVQEAGSGVAPRQ